MLSVVGGAERCGVCVCAESCGVCVCAERCVCACVCACCVCDGCACVLLYACVCVVCVNKLYSTGDCFVWSLLCMMQGKFVYNFK